PRETDRRRVSRILAPAPMPEGIALAEHGTVRQTVLIVDDHADFRAAARELLEADGYAVIGEAADGAGALHKVEELRPAIVLLDIQLPDSNGFDVAARLAAGPSPPVVVLISSRDAAVYGDRVAQASVRGFISKLRLSGASLAEVVG